MKIYTKTGDLGETGLFSGERVQKSHPLVAAYGTSDELCSHLGVVVAHEPAPAVQAILVSLQGSLFDLGADLATPLGTREIPRISEVEIRELEGIIDHLSAQLPPLRAFILPSGTPAAAHLHVARTVARRNEREVAAAAATTPINPNALIFLNRLSDLLFLLARYENHLQHRPETEWHGKAPEKKAGCF
jgi:cob(I)alamin adenosyltransferase